MTLGLVLVDALSEDLQAGLTAEQQAVFEQLNTPAQAGAEFFDFSTLVTQLRDSAPVRDIPVIVLTADIPQLTPEVVASGQLPPDVDQEFADALWAAQMSAQDLLPAKFTDAVHVTDTRSNHYIQLGNPQLVINPIRDVVHEVRETGHVRTLHELICAFFVAAVTPLPASRPTNGVRDESVSGVPMLGNPRQFFGVAPRCRTLDPCGAS